MSGLIPLNILIFHLYKKVLQITIISGHTLDITLGINLFTDLFSGLFTKDENLVLTTLGAGTETLARRMFSPNPMGHGIVNLLLRFDEIFNNISLIYCFAKKRPSS